MQKHEKGDTISETGNWNVADQYTKSKIMRPLNLCDYYEDIAFFGYESIAEELIGFQSPPNDFIKFKAIKRLVKELIRVIDNSKFALKKAGTKKTILEYRKHLTGLEKIIPKLFKIKYNQVQKTSTMIMLDPVVFENVLEKISEIKSKINEPLNKNHLIFTDKEDFDPKKFKDNLKRRMVHQG